MAPTARRRGAAAAAASNLPPFFVTGPAGSSVTGNSSEVAVGPSPDGKPVAHVSKNKSPTKKRRTASSSLHTEESTGAPEEIKTCTICLDVPSHDSLSTINKCEHVFCFECIEKWSEHENTCPLCKVRFTKIDRVNKPPPVVKKRKAKGSNDCATKQSKRVRRKDQRSDMGGMNSLHGLFGNIEAPISAHNIPNSLAAHLLFTGLSGHHHQPQHISIPPTGSLSMHVDMPAGSAHTWITRPSLGNGIPQEFLHNVRRVSSRTTRIRDSMEPQPRFGNLVVQQFRQTFNNVPSNWAQVLTDPHDVPRSYASNSDEVNAGVTPATALEIDDSDDEDGIVEVVVS